MLPFVTSGVAEIPHLDEATSGPSRRPWIAYRRSLKVSRCGTVVVVRGQATGILSSGFADFGRLNRFQEMSASGPFFGKLVGAYANKIAWQGSRLMELTNSFLTLLQQCAPVFTAPTFHTFLQVVTGWILSHRHRYVTDILFSSGNVDNGHWSRFHRFFSHAAWDMAVLCLHLVRLVVSLLAPGALLLWAVDDTLCRKR